MAKGFTDKARRGRPYGTRSLQDRVVRFPLSPHVRIPNLAGAREAARLLFTLKSWESAKRITVNPKR